MRSQPLSLRAPERFKEFMELAINFSEAFQLLNNGGPSRQKKASTEGRGSSKKDRTSLAKSKNNAKTYDIKDGEKRQIFLWDPLKVMGNRRFLRDCIMYLED